MTHSMYHMTLQSRRPSAISRDFGLRVRAEPSMTRWTELYKFDCPLDVGTSHS
jgi:hypothetical protein